MDFTKKVGTLILIEVTVLWLLKSFSFKFGYVGNDIEKSILASIGRLLTFFFYPVGITDWRIPVAFLSGLFAKEAIVGTLHLLYPLGLTLTITQALAVLAFSMVYTPCFSAVHMAKEEIGGRLATFSAIFQALFALFFCYFVNIIAQLVLKKLIVYVIILMLIVLLTYFLLRSVFRWRKPKKQVE